MSQSGVQNVQNSGSDSDSEEESQMSSQQQSKNVVSSSSLTISQSTIENIKNADEEEEDSDESDSEEEDDQMNTDPDLVAKVGQASAETESSSDSSDSDEENVEVDLEEVERKLALVNEKLQDSPNGYELLVEKISILRLYAELTELRQTRDKLSSLYPLSESLWLDWIKDELKLAHTDEEKKLITDLFERAVKDYLSIEVWLEYTKFVLSEMGAEDGVQRCRDIFERALGAGGLHVALGSLIWDAYRDFEAALIGLCTDEESRIDQEKRYTNICRRQLSVPLCGMDETYEDINAKLAVEDMTPVKERYDVALKKLKSIEPYEQQIVHAVDGDVTAKVQIYKDYIHFEKNEKSNPARIQCLYERALAECPLDSSLWIDYIHYVLIGLSIADIVMNVCTRATRNCPWVLETWMEYFLVAERFDSEKLVGIFELAVLNCYTVEQAGALWLKYLECLRRILTKNDYPEKDVQIFYSSCARAEEHLLTMSNVEPNEYLFQIAMMNIRLRALRPDGMKQARELWTDLLLRNYGYSFRNWLQFLLLEQRFGDAASYRHQLSKASAYVKDDIHSIASLWLNFERDNGDAHQLQVCEKKIAKYLEEQSSQAEYDTRRHDNFSRNRRPREFSHGVKGKFQADDGRQRGQPRQRRFPANGDNGPPRKFQEGGDGRQQHAKFQNDNYDRHGSQQPFKKQHQAERKRKFQGDNNKDQDGSQPAKKKFPDHDNVDGHQQNPQEKGEMTASDAHTKKDDGVFKVPQTRKPKFERPNRTPTRMLQRRPPTSFVPRSLQINKSNTTTEAPTVTTTTVESAPKTPMSNKDFRAKFLGTSSSTKND